MSCKGSNTSYESEDNGSEQSISSSRDKAILGNSQGSIFLRWLAQLSTHSDLASLVF